MINEFAAHVLRAVRFWTRFDPPAFSFEREPHGPPVMRELAQAAPLPGAIVGLCGALILVVAAALRLPAEACAVLTVATMAWATRAMHEDGLADLADAAGGTTPERRLEIMRDSRLGAYGVLTLCLISILRVVVLATLLRVNGTVGAGILVIVCAALARVAGLWPMAALPPAGGGTMAQATGGLTKTLWLTALLPVAIVFSVAATMFAGAGPALAAQLLAFATVAATTQLAWRLLGGYNGDACGAATLLAETALLAGCIVGTA